MEINLASTLQYVKDDLKNTSLDTIVIDKEKLFRVYRTMGYGDEGTIYNYNDKIVFKIFNTISDLKRLPKKFKKIELLGKLRDKSACFPLGLVGFDDLKKEGYYCEYVHPQEKMKDFDSLQFLKNSKEKLKYIIEADKAIKRFHKMGIVVGDIKGNNILVDSNGNVKFIDTDNWMYGDYGFDTIPKRSEWLSERYKRDFSLIDNDKFVYALLVLDAIVSGTIVSFAPNDRYFKKLIEFLNVSDEMKDGLRLILSDADNKPYISDVIGNNCIDENIISRDNIYTLNRNFR